MSIKRILVPIPGSFEQSGNQTAELEMAVSAAKALGAHLEALFITPPTATNRGQMAINQIGYRTVTAAALAPVADWQAEQRERIVGEAHDRFVQIAVPAVSRFCRRMTNPARR